MALLLAGGCEDPNLSVLADAAQKATVDFLDLRLPFSESPAFCWALEEGPPRFSGKEIKATGAFIRHDVFGGMKDPRPAVRTRAFAWYQTLMGWLLSEPGIRMFNRQMSPAASNKPAALMLAREAGLRIPSTLITNEADKLHGDQAGSMIAKPVLGGDYCYSLSDALGKTDLRDGLAAMPAIVQKRLEAPEVRIYVIGESAFAFEVRSSSLDYRVNQDAELLLLAEVPQELSRLRKLMSRLGMDFGAADFKTDPDTGQLVFLELNTSPMFARFDLVSGGQLCAAMVHELTAA
jgi:glutathione synthase/RimK-type ligase-like ATP-grasp enzyme